MLPLAAILTTCCVGGPRFEDVTVRAGIDPQRVGDATVAITGGAAWLDWDEDGHWDLILTGDAAELTVYRNLGPPDWTFEDLTQHSGLAGMHGTFGLDTLRFADGSLGLVILQGGAFGPARARVFRQEAPADEFVELGASNPGADAFSVTHGDLDGDGDHDLVVSTVAACPHAPSEINALFRLDDDWGVFVPHNGDGWPAPGCLPIVMVTDYDDNGIPVVLSTNDYGVVHTPTLVIRPTGIDRSLPAVYGMGIAAGDVNGDLKTDYLFTSIGDDALWVSGAQGRANRADEYGAANGWGTEWPRYKWGAAFIDVDLDGDLELFVTAGHQLEGGPYQSDEKQRSILVDNEQDVAADAGVATETSDRAVAVADYDEDGRPDLLVGSIERWYLFRNTTEVAGAHWLSLRVEDAPGARVLITCGQRVWQREWTGGVTGVAPSPELYVGLGACAGPATVQVRWPWAGETTLSNVAVDARVSIAKPEVVTVEPQSVPPGGTYTVTYRGPGTATSVGGVPLTSDGSAHMATFTAPATAGERRIEVVVDGKLVPLRPRLRVGGTEPVRLVYDPDPPRVGLSTRVTVVGKTNGKSGIHIVSGGDPLDVGPELRMSGSVVLLPKGGPLVLQPLEGNQPLGAPITCLPIESVDPERSYFEVTPLADGQFRLSSRLIDTFGRVVVPSAQHLALLRDGVDDPEAAFFLSPEGDVVVEFSGAQAVGLRANGVTLKQSASVAAPGPVSPARSLLFSLFPTAHADGQDVVSMLLFLADEGGRVLDLPEDLELTLDGLTRLDGWTPVTMGPRRYFITRLRTDDQPGVATVRVLGLTASVVKLASWHAEPSSANTTLTLSDDGLRLVCIPRDARGHLVGSGVDAVVTSLNATSQPPSRMEYDGRGGYVLATRGGPTRVRIDDRFDLFIGLTEPPSGCATARGRPVPTVHVWGWLGFALATLAMARRTRRRASVANGDASASRRA